MVRVAGVATYLRINPGNGVVEAGGISVFPRRHKTPATTGAMFVMLKHAFEEFGYRRYEWKCDVLKAASCRAAERFGFSYDGYSGRRSSTVDTIEILGFIFIYYSC